MHYISGFISLIIGIGAIVIGIFGLNQYFGGDERKLHKMEKLKSEGQITIAEIDTLVLEITIKRMKTYSLGYKFEADGKQYKGSFAFGSYDALDSLTPVVTYLPSNPKINALDIDGVLSKAKKEVAYNESSSAGLWVGIGLILFGQFNLYRAYRRFTYKEPPRSSPPPPVPPAPTQYPPAEDFV
ncbi:MAG TPA: hypothetical protein VFG10_03335 [Saprospiraceae bacterium]|nr:hypothetical protein [Saprospiraceae bacterium]